MALLFDWAWRSPSRSARLLRFWEHRHDKTGDTKVMWEHVQAETARGCTTDSRTTFWTGRLALHCEAAVRAWQFDQVSRFTIAVASNPERLDANELLPSLRGLPHMGAYTAVVFLRGLAPALGLQLRMTAGRVQDMSPSLTALARILPVAEVKRCRRLATNGYRCISSGCAAAILCETGKAMVRLGLLRAGFSCMGQLALEETLSGAAAKWLVQILARTQPLSEEQQLRVHRPPDEEASEVDACLPPLGEEFENGPHFCRGSESLIVEIWPQLRRLGWRQPVRRWLSRHKTLRRKKVLEQTTTTHPTREWSGM